MAEALKFWVAKIIVDIGIAAGVCILAFLFVAAMILRSNRTKAR